MEVDSKVGHSCISTTIKLGTNIISVISISRISSNGFGINQDWFFNCRNVGFKNWNCLREVVKGSELVGCELLCINAKHLYLLCFDVGTINSRIIIIGIPWKNVRGTSQRHELDVDSVQGDRLDILHPIRAIHKV